jgi:hypothetical protein
MMRLRKVHSPTFAYIPDRSNPERLSSTSGVLTHVADVGSGHRPSRRGSES